MSMSAALLLTVVLTLLEAIVAQKYWKNTTACLQHNKQGATKLLKLLNNYLLMVIFETDKNYSIWFEILNNA